LITSAGGDPLTQQDKANIFSEMISRTSKELKRNLKTSKGDLELLKNVEQMVKVNKL